MMYSRKPNYGYLFFTFFITFFFIVLPNIFGHFGVYQLFLGGIALFFLYRFLKSKRRLNIDNDILTFSYPLLFKNYKIRLQDISEVTINVVISFALWRPSVGSDPAPGQGYFVLLKLKKSGGEVISIKLSDFCFYMNKQLDILDSITSRVSAKAFLNYKIPIHGGKSQAEYIKKVKLLFSRFEASKE